MQPSYKHTQAGHLILVFLVVPIMIFSATFFFPMSPENNQIRDMVMALLGILFGLLILLFGSLTVIIADGKIQIAFGVFRWIRKTIDLNVVLSCKVVRNKWFYGWGIRYTPYGWLWNVSGLDAVELAFLTGRKFRIGTDEPHALERAIVEALRPSGD